MKRKISAVIAAIMLVFCTCESAGAINVILNSALVKFPDQAPVVQNGTVLVPIRQIASALGLTVSWDEGKRLVTLENDSFYVELTIDSTTAKTKDGNVTLSAPPCIIEGRTMVPLVFVAETMGLKVLWSEEYQRVIINGNVDKSPLTTAESGEKSEAASESVEKQTTEKEESVEEATEADDGETAVISMPSSTISIDIPDSFSIDGEDETSFFYRAADATDIQHLYDWSSVSFSSGYADSTLNNGILIVVQDFEPYTGDLPDVSRINEAYPERPENPGIDSREVMNNLVSMVIEDMFTSSGKEVPENVDSLSYDELASLLGYESEEEFYSAFQEASNNFDKDTVPGYTEYMEYMQESMSYGVEYNTLYQLKKNAMRNFAALADETSDEEWAKFFTNQLNTDPEVRYENVEIVTINGKKAVCGTIYAEDPDDEQGTFSFCLYYDGDSRATIYGGSLYSSSASAEASDALSAMRIE
jgi:hypothetical protein